MDGFQGAGIINLATDKVTGAQVAGIANVADEIDGVQISGIANVARKVNGAQISFVNIADTVDGVAIGFFSFVVQGYHKAEVYANEAIYGNFAFKTGTKHFYNIFSVGFRPADTALWSYGYGIGTEIKLSEKMLLNLDLSSNNIQRVTGYRSQLNLLNRLDMTFARKFGERFAVFAGPALNLYIFNYAYSTDSTPIDIAPYTFSDDTFRNTRLQTWAGLKAGIRLF